MKSLIHEKRRVSLLNLCKNKDYVNSLVIDYFEAQNISVLSYLKENNPYVVIIAEYPIHVDELLNALDPYRKFCEKVLLFVITDKKIVETGFSTKLMQYGITDIIFIDNSVQITDKLSHHFKNWVTIKNVVNDITPKKSDIRNYFNKEDEFISLAFSFC